MKSKIKNKLAYLQFWEAEKWFRLIQMLLIFVVCLTGLSRASYLKSKVKGKGACVEFWRAEKRLR
jgi:hypothetical protein